jgi:NADH:ubiquinone reductase (non-electrogenic)
MKEVENAIAIQKSVLEKLERANSLLQSNTTNSQEINRLIENELHWVIVGGGPSGVELTAELCDFLGSDVKEHFPLLHNKVKITLIEATNRILPAFDAEIAQYAKESLEKLGANVLCNTLVTKVDTQSMDLRFKDRTANSTTSSSSSSAYVTETVQCGLRVWAGGINIRPVTRSIMASLPTSSLQVSPRGLLVDKKLRVLGSSSVDTSNAGNHATAGGNGSSSVGVGDGTDGTLFALGDCAVSGYAPTAQVANQQGKYLGRYFRDTDCFRNIEKCRHWPDFEYCDQGVLAYVGGSKGVASVKPLLWDLYPMGSKGKKESAKYQNIEGASAYAIWRSLYFSKLMSYRNRAKVAFDWYKTSVFGREISTPYIMKRSSESSADLQKK